MTHDPTAKRLRLLRELSDHHERRAMEAESARETSAAVLHRARAGKLRAAVIELERGAEPERAQ